MIKIKFLVLLFFFFFLIFGDRNEILVSASECPKVWLTVSSFWRTVANSSYLIDSDLEVNWRVNCSGALFPEVIKVFDDDPTQSVYKF